MSGRQPGFVTRGDACRIKVGVCLPSPDALLLLPSPSQATEVLRSLVAVARQP